MTCFGFVFNSEIEKEVTKDSKIKVINYEKERFLEELLLSTMRLSIWSKFIRKSFIEKKKVYSNIIYRGYTISILFSFIWRVLCSNLLFL